MYIILVYLKTGKFQYKENIILTISGNNCNFTKHDILDTHIAHSIYTHTLLITYIMRLMPCILISLCMVHSGAFWGG